MKKLVVLALLALTAAASAPVVYAEEIKLTTIVPDQSTLRSKRGVIGEAYIDPANPAYVSDASIPTSGFLVEGNVGVGTAAPKSRLDVEGGLAVGASYSGTSAAPANGMIVEGNVGIGSPTLQLPAPGPGGTPDTGNLDVNDVYLRSIDRWVSQLAAGGGIEKTGQTKVYRIGDDGYYQKGAPAEGPRFTDNDNGTVTDNATGLMWVKDPMAAGTGGSNFRWNSAIDICEDLVYAGYDDWRLPNINELESIVDHSRTLNGVMYEEIDVVGSSYCAWSSTTRENRSADAFFVHFGYGNKDSESKLTAAGMSVRPVRGP